MKHAASYVGEATDGQLCGSSGTVDITERWLDSYQLAPGVARVKLWDGRLRGFGVIVGKERRSFVVRAYVKGKRVRRLVTLGHWALGKLRAADAEIRDRTMTVTMARSAAITEHGAMHGGEGPGPAPGGSPPQGRPAAQHHVAGR